MSKGFGLLARVTGLLRDAANDIRADRRGVTAVIFVIALVPIAVASGASIDMGRAYVVKARLAYALDAAGLAVGSATTTDEDELNQIMQDYFDANYPESRLGTPATPEMEIIGNEIHLSVDADVETTLMNVVGIHSISVSTTSVVIRETKGLEVAMVLDVTGSMSGTKIESLKEAANDFIDILFGDLAENDRVKISVVPFSQTVNIGTNNSTFVKDIDSRFNGTTWGGCIEERVTPNDTNDDYVASNAANGRWRAYGWQDTNNSENNYPPITATKGPNKNCVSAAILPLTSVKATLQDKIDSMTIGGNTHVPIGAVWGWRTLSPTEPFTEGSPYGDDEFDKAIIIMTDGENTFSTDTDKYSGYGRPTNTAGPPPGARHSSKLNCGSETQCVNRINTRQTTVCDNIKAAGITVYTVGFALAGNNTALNLLRDCATDTSKFFDSPTNEDLKDAFKQIGTELSNLRIGQ